MVAEERRTRTDNAPMGKFQVQHTAEALLTYVDHHAASFASDERLYNDPAVCWLGSGSGSRDFQGQTYAYLR